MLDELLDEDELLAMLVELFVMLLLLLFAEIVEVFVDDKTALVGEDVVARVIQVFLLILCTMRLRQSKLEPFADVVESNSVREF